MKRYLPIILLFIILSVNIFVRLGTVSLSFTRDIAENSVISDITKDAREIIEQKFKDLPLDSENKAVQDLVNILKKEKREFIEEASEERQKELKSYWQDDSGHTFLLEYDPYHWFRLVRNLVLYGIKGDNLIRKTQYDSFMLAPIGMKVDSRLHRNLHVYLSYFVFKLVSIFNKNISLMHFLFYMPVIISCLAIIATFFFCRSISNSYISSFFAATVLGLTPAFLQRSLAGWFDTDPYVILFSILPVWTFYLGLKQKAQFKKRLLFSVISGICVGLFSLTWDGWWYIFYLIIFSMLFFLLNLFNLHLIKRKTEKKINLKTPMISLSLFILFSVIFVYIFSGSEVIRNLISVPINFSFAKSYLQNDFWPNTFLTVIELKEVNFKNLFFNYREIFVFFLSIIYLIAALYYEKDNKGYKDKQFIIFLFLIWISIVAFVSINAMRFSILLTLPLAVSFGLFLETVLLFLRNIVTRFVIIRRIKETLVFVFCCAFIFIFIGNAAPFKNYAPSMNKDWRDVLILIKTQTSQDAIINSWWDYGHWLKAISERRVIFDGAGLDTPMAYWMGRFFLTDNEREAIGILRMLNSGSNKAFEELEKLGFDKYKSLDILNETIMLKQKEADAALSKYIPSEFERKRILSLTHQPQPAYLLVEPDIITNIGSISFLGGWDFNKARIYQQFKRLKKKETTVDYLMKEYKYNNEDALRIYNTLIFLSNKDALNWISPKSKYYFESENFRREGDLLLFDNGFIIDIINHNVYFDNAETKKWDIPKSIFYFEGGSLKEIKFKMSNSQYSILLIQDKDHYKIVCLDHRLANCMLTRLYFLNGKGLNNFQPFIEKKLKDGKGNIMVYKIEWKKDE